MAQDTNSFVDISKRPYWDDYDANKKFHKILYVPSRAVQARELNQQQSIFQEQIKRFANHVFKNGAMVIPGQVSFNDNIRYVRLDISSLTPSDGIPGLRKLFNGLLNSDNSLKQNVYIRGEESEIEGEVIDIFPRLEGMTDAEIDQLLVKYQSNYNTADQPIIFFRLSKGGKAENPAGTDENGTELFESYDNFINNEVIRFRDTDGRIGTRASDVGNYKGSGNSCMATINEGVYYMNGYFIQVDRQTIILDRYKNTPRCHVGLRYYESVITFNEDSSLNDNAQGSYNYAAPGADRLRIDLKLEKITLKDDEDFTGKNFDEETFIDLQHIDRGEVVFEVYRSEYAELEKTFARRTYDESGDYTVVPFQLDIKEHLRSKEKNFKNGKWLAKDKSHPGDRNKLALCLGPGKAYIKGYEHQKIANTWLETYKARVGVEGLQHEEVKLNELHKPDMTYFIVDKDTNIDIHWLDNNKNAILGIYKKKSTGTMANKVNDDLGWTIDPNSVDELANIGNGGSRIGICHYIDYEIVGSIIKIYVIFQGIDIKELYKKLNEIKSSNANAGFYLREIVYRQQVQYPEGNTYAASSLTDINGNPLPLTNGRIEPFYVVNGFCLNVKNYVIGNDKACSIAVMNEGNVSTMKTVNYSENANINTGSPASSNIITTVNKTISTEKLTRSYFGNARYSIILNNIGIVDSITGISFVYYKVSNVSNEGEVTISDTFISKPLIEGSHYTTESIIGENNNTSDNTVIITFNITNITDGINSYNNVENLYVNNSIDNNNPYFVIEYTENKIDSESDKKYIAYALESFEYGVKVAVGKTHALSRHDGIDFLAIFKADSNYVSTPGNIKATVEVVGEDENGNPTEDINQVNVKSVDVNSVGRFHGNVIALKFNNKEQITDYSTDFIFHGGQYDNYYDFATVKLKPNKKIDLADNENCYILYRYFARYENDHQSGGANTKDMRYYNVDSYVHPGGIKYEDIPAYVTSYGVKIPLQNAIDVRPDIGKMSIGVGTYYTFDINHVFANYYHPGLVGLPSVLPYGLKMPDTGLPIKQSSDNISLSYAYLLPRYDKIFIDQEGKFGIVHGVPAKNPISPEVPSNSMALYEIYLDAYTYSVNKVIKKYIENKRYTMRDIGKLEKRIDNLEKYCEMSMLELQTLSMQVKYSGEYYSNNTDLLDTERFKNGFTIETFASHSGQYTHPDYKCSIDTENQILKPTFSTEYLDLILQNKTSSKEIKNGLVSNNGLGSPLITLPYTSKTFIEQTKASATVNVNPFQVATYNGNISFSPDSDSWFDSKTIGTKTIEYDGYYDAVNYIAENIVDGTHWGDWYQTGSVSSIKTEPSVTIAEHSEKVLVGTNARSNTVKYKTGTGGNTGEAVYIDEYHRKRNSGAIARETTTTTTSTYETTTAVTKATTTHTMTVTDWKRDGTIVNHKNVINQDDIGDRVVGISNVQYMRSIPVLVKADMMCPNTRVFPFFDDVDVKEYCSQCPIVEIQSLSDELHFITTTGMEEEVTIDGYTVGKVVFASENLLTLVNVKEADRTKFIAGKTIKGKLSGATAVLKKDNVKTQSRGHIEVSSDGTCALVFTIPNDDKLKFKCGDRLFVLNDKANNTQSLVTRAEGIFSAKGYVLQKENTVLKTKTIQFSEIPVSENNRVKTNTSNTTYSTETTSNISTEVDTVKRTSYYDPLAQSFLIEEKGGCFITSISVAFFKKDPKLPIRLEIHEMNNGYPTQSIVPYSVCVKQAKDVVIVNQEQIRRNGKILSAHETTFVMEAPVYLQQNVEYCFVLLSDSFLYEVYCAELGGMNYANNLRITEQAYNGVLFKSQNASTWTADQNLDMYFKINKAQFDITKHTTLKFTHETEKLQPSYYSDPFETFAGKNYFKVFQPNHGFKANQQIEIKYTKPSNVTGNTLNNVPMSYFKTGSVMKEGLTLDSLLVKYPSTPNTVFSGRCGGDNVDIEKRIPFNLFRLNTSTISLNNTNVEWYYNYTKASNGSTLLKKNKLNLYEDNTTKESGVVICGKPNSFSIEAVLSSNEKNISPAIDINRLGVIFVNNRIDNMSFITMDRTLFASNLTYNTNNNTLTIANFVPMYNANNDGNQFILMNGSHIGLELTKNGNTIEFWSPITFIGESIRVPFAEDGMHVLDLFAEGDNSTISATAIVNSVQKIKICTTDTNYISEQANINSSLASKYISNVISTGEKESHACKIMFSATRFKHSTFDLYIKMINENNSLVSMDTEQWKMIPTPDEWKTVYSSNMQDFKNFEIVIEYDKDYLNKQASNASIADRDKFTSVAVKLVMKHTNPSKLHETVQFKNLRILCVL